MTIPTGAYSDTADLLHGDIPLPQRHGTGAGMVVSAAEDIDAHIGHIYVTPIVIDTTDPKNRPSSLLLKKINNYIASGRILLDMAAASEDRDLHAYGQSLLAEGLGLLYKLSSGELVLTGCPNIEGDDSSAPVKLQIFNEDPSSLVEGFYRRTNGQVGIFEAPILPYGDREVS